MTRTKKRVLVYDINASGHCPGWLYLVASGFSKHGAEVLVCCRKDHLEVTSWIPKIIGSGCQIIEEPSDPENPFLHATTVAEQHGIRCIFFPNFDSIVYALGKKDNPGIFRDIDIGGIWLRPELTGENQTPLRKLLNRLDRTRRGKLARKHSRAVRNNRNGLTQILHEKSASLQLFFTSADAAAKSLPHIEAETAQLICDPWLDKCKTSREAARVKLGLPIDATVFLHAGTSRPEKGLRDACEAMLRMNRGELEKTILLRSGKVDPGDAPSLSKLESRGAALVLDRFISEEELGGCYAACDWVLLPYRNQTESSGILIHAAANCRPVIACDHGLIGKCVREYELGIVFTHQDIGSLSNSITQALGKNENLISAGMLDFTTINSPESFQRTLCEKWLDRIT